MCTFRPQIIVLVEATLEEICWEWGDRSNLSGIDILLLMSYMEDFMCICFTYFDF